MGTAYKGNSSQYRSIGQNIMTVSKSYEYKNGFFGKNSVHGKERTRNIFSSDNLSTAQDFFDKIAYGGKKYKSTDNMKVYIMADGTFITMRKKSMSDGTPVVDINIAKSKSSGGIKSQKIHFVLEEKNGKN